MLAAYCKANEENTNCARLLGTATPKHNSVLIGEESPSILLSSGEGSYDECSFIGIPSDADIIAFCENAESLGSIAYAGSESTGSVAIGGSSESCGSVASSCGSSSSGGCSYSC